MISFLPFFRYFFLPPFHYAADKFAREKEIWKWNKGEWNREWTRYTSTKCHRIRKHWRVINRSFSWTFACCLLMTMGTELSWDLVSCCVCTVDWANDPRLHFVEWQSSPKRPRRQPEGRSPQGFDIEQLFGHGEPCIKRQSRAERSTKSDRLKVELVAMDRWLMSCDLPQRSILHTWARGQRRNHDQSRFTAIADFFPVIDQWHIFTWCIGLNLEATKSSW